MAINTSTKPLPNWMHYLVLRVSLLIEWKWWSNRRQAKGEFSVMVAMVGIAMEYDWWCVHHSRQMLNDRTQFMTISKMHKTTELNIASVPLQASTAYTFDIYCYLPEVSCIQFKGIFQCKIANVQHWKRWIKLPTLSCRTEQTTTGYSSWECNCFIICLCRSLNLRAETFSGVCVYLYVWLA